MTSSFQSSRLKQRATMASKLWADINNKMTVKKHTHGANKMLSRGKGAGYLCKPDEPSLIPGTHINTLYTKMHAPPHTHTQFFTCKLYDTEKKVSGSIS